MVVTKKRANRLSIIHCTENTIAWEQRPFHWRLAGKMTGDKVPVFKYKADNSCTTIVMVKGVPNAIAGLDEGIFRCADHFPKDCLHVMTWRRFEKL